MNLRPGGSSLAKYAANLPTIDWKAVPSLGEGGTPLVKSISIGPGLGIDNLYFKLESCNPTGSYKDRFIVCELALKKAQEYNVCLATSSGNTGASLASYAPRFGMRCHIFVLEETPDDKLTQMVAHGAQVHRVRQYGKSLSVSRTVPQTLKQMAQTPGIGLVISAYRYSPDGMEGVKTISYEIVEQLGRAPEHVFVPVGGGGLYSAVTRGFLEMRDAHGPARVHIVQPDTNDTIVSPLRRGEVSPQAIEAGTTVSGLAILDDIDGSRALDLAHRIGGQGFLPTEQEIFETQRELLREEGIYAEPAGATSVAGLKRAIIEGQVKSSDVVVCIISGHGFKDVTSLPSVDEGVAFIQADEIERVIGGG